MKKLLFCALLLSLPATAAARNDKIDPASFICAEFVALAAVAQEPPLFEGLQIDGFAAAADGQTVASAGVMPALLASVNAVCGARPTDKVLSIWRKGRQSAGVPSDGPWRADKTTCRDYAENEDDGSGFVIWLDGYHRQKSGSGDSVLESDARLQDYLKACGRRPDALMLDVMRDFLKK